MIDLLFCGYNLSCHLNNLKGPKYPSEVAEICYYFEKQKEQLPEYCKWTNQPSPVRKRNEF